MSAVNATPPALLQFGKLAPRVFLFTPTQHAPGQLIVLCTWLGAARKHIEKYIRSYQDIAPHSKILLVESDVRILTSSYPTQRGAIIPAAEVVRTALSETSNAKILLHTFSNGGPNSATQLLLVLHEQMRGPIPIVGIICDSGPAAGEYWKSYNAMVLSLPKGFARIAGSALVHVILILLYASIAAGRYPKTEDLIRSTLLDPQMVQERGGKEGKICYIYSKADKLVGWKDVSNHAEIARDKGWEVSEWLLEETAHCNHFSMNEEKYTRIMRCMWQGKKIIDQSRL